MQGRWGMAWLAVAIWLVSLMWAPLPGMAAEGDAWSNPVSVRLPLLQTAAQTPMEAQMLGEKPFQANPSLLRPEKSLLPETPGLALDDDGGAALRLPYNFEFRISVLYDREPASPLDPKRRKDSPMLFKYSMDYRLLSNLQVGLNGYLYHPYADEGFSFQRPLGDRDRVLGLGPGIRYDLGHWSFVLKSQLETGNRDRGDNLQNWFRVWYAF